MTKRRRTGYKIVATERLKENRKDTGSRDSIDLSSRILEFRKSRNMAAVELCQRARDLDPKTLNALEKGRIRNPSIKTLESVARGLGIMVSDLFKAAETTLDRNLYMGSPKGAYQIDFPNKGVKMISFTPLVKDFFCGKVILSSRAKMDNTLLKHPLPTYIAVLVGKIEARVEDKAFNLREGENLFFNGLLNHTFYNPLERDTAFLLVTSPSFL